VADLHIDTNVTAPKVVNIPFVRADMLGMSSTFRVCFEVALSVASAALGALINAPSPIPKAHWALLLLSAGATVAFFVLDQRWKRKALAGE
jgi:hypothetical protein